MFNDKIFREYDIRGVVGKDFDEDLAYALGRVFGDAVIREAGSNVETKALQVAVGNDCRVTTPLLREALSRGLRESGVSVLLCGMGPTPQLYYSVVSGELAGGIQITASHNPGEYNGFKMMIGARTLSGDSIAALRDAIKGGLASAASEMGDLKEVDARALYLQELVARSKDHMGKRHLKIVVDAGNGVGGLVGPELLRDLGCEVIELFTDPDGRFPNHHPDPTEVANLVDLQKKVLDEKADLGIAWDGDADRIGVVDEKANPIFGDMLLIIYGRQLLQEIEQPVIIGDVKCSELFFSDLQVKGAKTVMAKTGHSLIKAKLKELKAHLAGEMSGHMFFAHRYYGFDDAIHASARLVEILSNTDRHMSELLSDLPEMYSTPEIRMDCPDEIKFEVARQAQKLFPEYEVNTLDGVRITFDEGWGLVRASNTQPALVMRFEAKDEQALSRYQNLVNDRVMKLQSTLRDAC